MNKELKGYISEQKIYYCGKRKKLVNKQLCLLTCVRMQ